MQIKIIVALVTIIGLLLLGNYVQNLRKDVHRLKAERNTAQANEQQCNDDKKITEGVSHDYQIKAAALRTQLAALKRLRDHAQCVPVAGETGGSDGAAAGGKLSGGNGVSAGYLLDFAARCEDDRLKILGLQQFVTKTWSRPSPTAE